MEKKRKFVKTVSFFFLVITNNNFEKLLTNQK